MAGSASELSRKRPSRADAGRWVLWAAVAGMALLTLTVGGALAHVGGVAPEPLGLLLAVAAIWVAQSARVPVQMGPDLIMLGWGELGLVAVLCLVPVLWVAIVVAIGAVLGNAHRFLGGDRTWRIRLTYALANKTAAAGIAGWAVIATDPHPRRLDPSADVVRVELDRPMTLLPLVLAALIYFLVTSWFTAAWVAPRGPFSGAAGAGPGPGVAKTWQRLASVKRRILVGNIAAALAMAVAIAADRRWLLALVPVLWALHRAYAFHLRSRAQRTNWVALAEATREARPGRRRGGGPVRPARRERTVRTRRRRTDPRTTGRAAALRLHRPGGPSAAVPEATSVNPWPDLIASAAARPWRRSRPRDQVAVASSTSADTTWASCG